MELAAKLGTKSPVWQAFGLAVDENRKVKSERPSNFLPLPKNCDGEG